MIRKNSRYNLRCKKGFTLIELLLTIAITSLVIILSANLLNLGIRSHKLTVKEYNLQSSIRRVTEETTKIVRYSKAVFAVPITFISNTNSMDPGWDYFMVSSDGKRIVSMEYNGVQHEERVLVSGQDKIKYEVFFEKEASAKSESVMKYKIYAYIIDDKGNKTREKIVFESTVESTNAVQVVDKGTKASPSVALAYRNDGQTSGKGKNQMAYVTVVVDVSGSMNQTPAGEGSVSKEKSSSRIRYVREALTGNADKQQEGIIQQFSKEENIFISIVPFSTTGNYPNPTDNMEPGDRHPIYNVYDESQEKNLVEVIKKTKAVGGTNTGDGLRQAYNLHSDFRRIKSIKEEDQVHHYMILLVDGETTYETEIGNWVDNGEYRYNNTDREDNKYYQNYLWRTEWSFLNSKYYLDSGHYNFSSIKDEPTTFINSEHRGYSGSGTRWDPYIDYYNDYYGKRNSNIVDALRLYGNGNTVITNSQYVTSVGNLIKNFEDGNGVKSYMIGYANNLGTHINSIGTSIGTKSENIYRYDKPGFNLDEVFKNIANDIMSDFWLVSGPQIKK
ncbi:MAG: prepilin-type N-terminal cleavage/methylation domain-containing protein [Clostridium sp.]|uniref:prepilin-type N-terminal cleavage/methylation domain-containing protein n=1 Tax=Clostridium sp. TaxID=1506 RepID=UPI003D6D4F4D